MRRIPLSYYRNSDVVFLAEDLLGKFLFTKFQGKTTGGMIIETEAYRGPEDRASHSYKNKRTKRNEMMFYEGGVCYVYFVYGLHSMFNIVTNEKGVPHAILIRAIKPEVGIDLMLERRKKEKLDKTLTNGPGALTQALGIERCHNGLPLNRDPIWLEDRGVVVKKENILIGPRVGIDYAEEDALLPWRFRLVMK